VLWYCLHTSYLPRACVLLESNLEAACTILGLVDELHMNPINFHVGRSSRLINGCYEGLLTRIHIHDHEINQGRRILELYQYILCYPIGLHDSIMDQWVFVQAVTDHLGQDVHTSSPITECMMDIEGSQDERNHGECWSTQLVQEIV
jgi:hypothetical protein